MMQVTSATLVIDHWWSRQSLCDSECDSMCECCRFFHGEHIKHIRSKDFEHNHNTITSMTYTSTCRDLSEINKQGECKDSHKLTEWAQVCAVIKWNPSREALKLMQGKILEGRCSCYNAWRHIGRTPASLFRFIASIGPWSFGKYWIAVLVTSVSPLTPWTYMVQPLPT